MITTRDGLINAMANNNSRIVLDKASIANAAAGQVFSLFRATGQPGQGVIPTAAAQCSNLLAGAIGFAQQTNPVKSYGAYLYALSSNNAMTLELHDRLAHMGGLNGTLTTAQTVNMNLSTYSNYNIGPRKGDANYSDVMWWLEWYTDTGATGVTANVQVILNDETNMVIPVPLGATQRAGRMMPINGLKTTFPNNFIKAVTSVTLSATTGTAGNFGVTATRPRMTYSLPLANFTPTPADWAALGMPEIFNESCLFPLVVTSTTSTGTLRGGGKIIHG